MAQYAIGAAPVSARSNESAFAIILLAESDAIADSLFPILKGIQSSVQRKKDFWSETAPEAPLYHGTLNDDSNQDKCGRPF